MCIRPKKKLFVSGNATESPTLDFWARPELFLWNFEKKKINFTLATLIQLAISYHFIQKKIAKKIKK